MSAFHSLRVRFRLATEQAACRQPATLIVQRTVPEPEEATTAPPSRLKVRASTGGPPRPPGVVASLIWCSVSASHSPIVPLVVAATGLVVADDPSRHATGGQLPQDHVATVAFPRPFLAEDRGEPSALWTE